MSQNPVAPTEASAAMVESATPSTTMVAYLSVEGMTCEDCAHNVRNALFALTGVLAVDILRPYGEVIVAYDRKWVTPDDMVGAVSQVDVDCDHHYEGQTLKVSTTNETPII